MNVDKLTSLTVSELLDLIRRGEVSPTELTSAYLERIERLNGRLNAYITVLKDEALRAAEEVERKIKQGEKLGSLCGVPIAIKDILDMKNIPTTCGSKVFVNEIASFDSTVVERLKGADAIILGKLNMHEIAYGLTNENPHYGATRNPWDVERISGGSSGGSAVAVAGDLCAASLGTDTGGSIRIPAALCGVVGLKPTYGRVSRFGCRALSWSLDHIGTLTKSVKDVALILQVIAGYDSKDPVTVHSTTDYEDAFIEDIKGMKVGIPKDFFFEDIDEEIEYAIDKAVELMKELGASVEEVEVPYAKYSRSIALIIMACEATSYYEKILLTHANEFGQDIIARLMLGRLFHAIDYLDAQRIRSFLIDKLERSMKDVDVLITPTTPITAPKIGESTIKIRGKVTDVRTQLARFTSIWNLAGFPALSIPCGFTNNNLPIGMQLIGKPFDEKSILRLAYVYEQNTTWHRRRPPLSYS
ncbi:MAG: aspartyl/glutamyl-tRNA amidotransferase subunit A [Nitrososphaerales archaeon]|nr:aspartyl/glutamyl-tRNA amidotransferase subunit A [Nitrososphaerales archaeon]